MNPLKTPHQLTLEEAGAIPQTNGFLKTPKQMLFEEAGVLPHYEEGGDVSPADMRAELMVRKGSSEPTEIEEPKFNTEDVPDVQNPQIFVQVRDVINNPGQLNTNDFDPVVVRELIKLFGPNIFAQS